MRQQQIILVKVFNVNMNASFIFFSTGVPALILSQRPAMIASSVVILSDFMCWNSVSFWSLLTFPNPSGFGSCKRKLATMDTCFFYEVLVDDFKNVATIIVTLLFTTHITATI